MLTRLLRPLLLSLALLAGVIAVPAAVAPDAAEAQSSNCSRILIHSPSTSRTVWANTSSYNWFVTCTSYFLVKCSNGQVFSTIYSAYGNQTNVLRAFTCPVGTTVTLKALTAW